MKKETNSQTNIKHKEALRLLKTAQGHLNAVISMVEDNRYCILYLTIIQTKFIDGHSRKNTIFNLPYY